MSTEAWLILNFAATSVLLAGTGIVVVWLTSRRAQRPWDRWVERRLGELNQRIQSLEARLDKNGKTKSSGDGETVSSQMVELRCNGHLLTTTNDRQRHESRARIDGDEAPLIVIPNLAAAGNDRDAVVSGVTQRYSAIWSLAASGSSPEVIARATGQPVGQIELILGLRRQIDGTRTTIPHAPHT
jgi:hypothetical protein